MRFAGWVEEKCDWPRRARRPADRFLQHEKNTDRDNEKERWRFGIGCGGGVQGDDVTCYKENVRRVTKSGLLVQPEVV